MQFQLLWFYDVQYGVISLHPFPSQTFVFLLSHAVTDKQTKYPPFLSSHCLLCQAAPWNELLLHLYRFVKPFYLLLNDRIYISSHYHWTQWHNTLHSKADLSQESFCVLKFSNIAVIYITLLLRKLSWGLRRLTIMFALRFTGSGRWTYLYINKD